MILKCILLLFITVFIDAQFTYYHQASPCAVPRIPHVRFRTMRRGNLIRYSCIARYTLVGNKYATCRGGHWDVPPPTCVKSGCPPLENVPNAVTMPSHNNSWIVFFCLPGHQLVGSPVVYCDGIRWNSSAPACVDGKAKPATECDFEDENICGWRLDDLHDFDWRRWNKKTPSYFLQTGPTYDHTYGKNGMGYYMYIESTGRVENETARLISPVYDKDMAANGCFVFFYHMFGRSMGGLRVYQKPEKVSLYEVLKGAGKERYLLFEKWGDQGNAWYSSVSMLSNFSDDFQIVIEGIRGASFMSDIAIDDVSIQFGENCSKAMVAATTPPSLLESCVGRCDMYGYDHELPQRGCGCEITCVVDENCCPDFLDVCAFNISNNDEDTASDASSDSLPQTQKLVATTTETLPPTTSTTTSTTTTTPSTTSTTSSTTTTSTTTRKPTTRVKPATTTRTTVRPTTKRLTTAKATTTTTRPTRPVFNSTTKAFNPTNATKVTAKVTPVTASTYFVTRTTILHDLVTEHVKSEPKSKSMSSVTSLVTGLVVSVMCVGALCLAFFLKRTTRGITTLARLRGRTCSDPEVRYLKTDVDDIE